MAKPKQNIQWASGTRPQRMNREDGQYEFEMEAIKKRVEERQLAMVEPAKTWFHKGDLVWCCGELKQIGEIDPMGKWAMIGPYKYSADCFKMPSEALQIAYMTDYEAHYQSGNSNAN